MVELLLDDHDAMLGSIKHSAWLVLLSIVAHMTRTRCRGGFVSLRQLELSSDSQCSAADLALKQLKFGAAATSIGAVMMQPYSLAKQSPRTRRPVFTQRAKWHNLREIRGLLMGMSDAFNLAHHACVSGDCL